MNETRFAGQHALVTGGGSGIGRAIALALAEQGATVQIIGLEPGPLAEVAALRPDKIHATVCDLRDAAHPVRALAVNVGSNAQYADDEGIVWLEDRPYAPGSFGYVGGTRGLLAREIVITDTRQTPLYSTYRAGLSAYRFDVPDGEYAVTLLFAEPGGAQGAAAAGGALPPGEVALPAEIEARAAEAALAARG